MGITHGELFRLLPAAIEHREYTVVGDRILITANDVPVEIQFSPERERQIASMRFPVTSLEFGFCDMNEFDIAAFMRRFDRVFHKGGG